MSVLDFLLNVETIVHGLQRGANKRLSSFYTKQLALLIAKEMHLNKKQAVQLRKEGLPRGLIDPYNTLDVFQSVMRLSHPEVSDRSLVSLLMNKLPTKTVVYVSLLSKKFFERLTKSQIQAEIAGRGATRYRSTKRTLNLGQNVILRL